MGRAHEKWHICKCLIFHAKNLLKVYNQKNSGYTKSRRKIRQQKIPKIDSKFLHIELLSREAWASKDTRFLTLSLFPIKQPYPVKHPGSLDILGNPAFPLYKRDVVDFLKAFPAQFIGKFFHIAVELPVPRGVCPFRSAPRGTQSY